MSTRLSMPSRLRFVPVAIGVVALLFWLSALFRYDMYACEGDSRDQAEVVCVGFDRWFQRPVRLVTAAESEKDQEKASKEEDEDPYKALEDDRRRDDDRTREDDRTRDNDRPY